jgi:hypothetical protein
MRLQSFLALGIIGVALAPSASGQSLQQNLFVTDGVVNAMAAGQVALFRPGSTSFAPRWRGGARRDD